MHEIITLQLGQRSNYLATHFWNTQESYFTYSPDQESLVDHDIHFRQGVGADGTETFTPRTLIYDLKGGFGSMRKINALYEIDEPASPQGLWNGPTVVQRQDQIQQNEYQRSLQEGVKPPQLTPESVRYWSDFNKIYFHPRSIIQLDEYEMNSSLTPFDNWTAGEELFSSLDKEHDLLDRDLRYLAEEADQMQGIQVMATVDDAWGGFAARYLDRIRDEYGKASVLFWGLEENVTAIPREKRLIKLSNAARSISDIAPQSSVFVPMSMPSTLPKYIALNQKSQWQASGLLSIAMESIALPSRLKLRNGNHATLDQLASSINVNGNQTIAKLGMRIDQKVTTNGDHSLASREVLSSTSDLRIPSQDSQDANLNITRPEHVENLGISFFPAETGPESHREREKIPHVFGQIEISRSDEEDLEQSHTFEEDQGYERAKRRAAGLSIIQKAEIPVPFPLLDSFPDIFSVTGQSPEPLRVTASLSTDTTVASRVKTLQHVVNRAISMDEREALSNSLGEIAEAYEEGWDSGTDEDED